MTAIKKRRSIRKFESKPIEENKLREILEAGRLSPSANNKQDWKFIVVNEKNTINKLAKAANNQTFIASAPVIIVACSINPTRKMSSGQFAGPVDVSIAVTQMILKSVEEGLGSCWIGAYNESEIKNILNIPKDVSVVALFPLGYAAENPTQEPRKDFKEVFIFEKWE
ncbi:MAG: nitroreductase family protein [Candidatus Firestonebacteria bacterium]